MQSNETFDENQNLFPVLLHEGVHVVNSRLIAEALGVNHSDWFRNVILKYKSKIESKFGILRFENGISKKVGQPQKYAYLTENQAIYVATLSRNTEEVVELKALLVLSFAKMRENLQDIQGLITHFAETFVEKSYIEASFQDLNQYLQNLYQRICSQEDSLQELNAKFVQKTNQRLFSQEKFLQELTTKFDKIEKTQKEEAQLLKQTREQVEKLMREFGIDAECFVYVFYSPLTGLHKIGWSEMIGIRRQKLQTALPDLEFVMAIPTRSKKEAITLEKLLHDHFATEKVDKEWFRLSKDDLITLQEYREFYQMQLEKQR